MTTTVLMVVFAGTASAATAVPLGTAASFAVLAGQTVTNTGPSVVSGDLGVSPGTAVTGFPPGLVDNGTQHVGDAVAAQAQSDLTNAYDNAAGQPASTNGPVELGGQTLLPGVYRSPTLGLTGTLTLDAQGDPGAVFLFQAGSTLITASNSSVMLINGANACNVFWQVGSSATLGTGTAFVGTILALTSISVQTGASVQGRVLARNGSVTLDSNRIDRTGCAATPAPTTTTAPPTTTTTAPPTTTTTAPPTTTTTAPPTTTTTAPPTTTTTAPPTTTTTAPPTTTTTAPPTTTTTAPPTTSTTAPPTTTTTAPPTTTTTAPPTTTTARPTTTMPSTTTRRPTTTKERPTTTKERPTTTRERPTTKERPTTVTERPTTRTGRPTTDTGRPTTTTSAPATTTSAAPAGGSGGGTTGGTGGGGDNGPTGGGSDVGSSGVTIIPLGHPETGAGGAAHAVDGGLIGLGGLAAGGAVVTAGLGLRRRRATSSADRFAGRDQGE